MIADTLPLDIEPLPLAEAPHAPEPDAEDAAGNAVRHFARAQVRLLIDGASAYLAFGKGKRNKHGQSLDIDAAADTLYYRIDPAFQTPLRRSWQIGPLASLDDIRADRYANVYADFVPDAVPRWATTGHWRFSCRPGQGCEYADTVYIALVLMLERLPMERYVEEWEATNGR